MVARFLLPSFGGSAGVWATCLAVFQMLLLAGYAYAHVLTRNVPLRNRPWVHLTFLLLALFSLPLSPHVPAAAEASAVPVFKLIWALVRSVGLPFLLLSATAPLLMDWYRHQETERDPDRLYAFSNAGSLVALLAYPVWLEPNLTLKTQSLLWSAGVILFWCLGLLVGWFSRTQLRRGCDASMTRVSAQVTTSFKSSPAWLWILLPACGSGLLLAITNQICQDVTPVPLLWVAPMGVYLLTFILCFEGPRSYRRGLFLPACIAGLGVLSWFLYYGGMQGFGVQLGAYLAILFIGCMVCHGELYRVRPNPEKLTAYYLCVAIGGAIGGSFVAIAAPFLFSNVLETPVLTMMLAVLITWLIWKEKILLRFGKKRIAAAPIALLGSLAIVAILAWVVSLRYQQSIYWARNFYGVYQVKEGPTWLINNVPFPLEHGPGRVLVSGQVYHGFQFLAPAAARYPTTYYSPESGLGVAFREMSVQTNRSIGAVGLGAGTLAAYAAAGDRIRFYELNPDVLDIARRYFTFLRDSAAKIDVVLGDGRLSLQREPDQQFDLLVLDAFSGDSIPTHLLTEEAMRVYLRHLAPEGVLAFHISNNHLDLEPVVRALAAQNGLSSILVPPTELDPRTGKLSSIWMLVSASRTFCTRPTIANLLASKANAGQGRQLLWTDDYFSILPVLR